jgi:phosphoenolpyruvate synthase/pyruvate phosphate dikinase
MSRAPSERLGTDIVWLGDPGGHDASRVGGKAANLSRLAAAYPVPPGFCLTSTAFEQFAGADRLTRAADFAETLIVPSLFGEIAESYRCLGELCRVNDPSVAVRSSAIGEDSRTASFAGQHDSFLNIVGIDAVVRAVARCWQSVLSPRAADYRRQQGLFTEQPTIAVLVQRLVPADISAVVFSGNPVTGNSDEVVINVSWGLGESIMGGTVTPDTYTLSKHNLTIASREIAQKERMTVLVPGGTEEVDVPRELRDHAAADESQVIEMATLAIELESTMGWSVDLECSYHEGRLHLLQCRPITTLRAS